jgi:hypothetical protein
MTMRLVVAIGALALIQVAGAQPGQASQAYYDGPWCAQFWGGDTHYMNCSMRSFEMCLAEIRGTGGNTLCSPNPRWRPTSGEPVARRRHHG